MPEPIARLMPALIAASDCEPRRCAIEAAVRHFRGRHDDPDFSRSSSSVRLRALGGHGHRFDAEELVREVWQGALRPVAEAWLGPRVALLVDQCWARCQYAPGCYPDGHAAHQWHQDGALHFDFVEPYPDDALLKMLTCWIALTPCGVDAPGLELVRTPFDRVLRPAELDATHFAPDACWRPVCAPGDAIVFGGGTLHRTHVADRMQAGRTSVELRFVAAQPTPPRLARERLIALPRPRDMAVGPTEQMRNA